MQFAFGNTYTWKIQDRGFEPTEEMNFSGSSQPLNFIAKNITWHVVVKRKPLRLAADQNRTRSYCTEQRETVCNNV